MDWRIIGLLPRLKERGGRVQTLVWRGWERSGDTEAVLWDEDVETVFLGDGHWTINDAVRIGAVRPAP
ncbi:MAG: hypothetical protein OXN90_08290 [Gemmatimonadota bacterium]|nr:hypothetical protein [Gemmatimonadota bacterium]